MGGIVGGSYGNLSKCTAYGMVSGVNDIGGIAGSISGKLYQCKGDASVKV